MQTLISDELFNIMKPAMSLELDKSVDYKNSKVIKKTQTTKKSKKTTKKMTKKNIKNDEKKYKKRLQKSKKK
jgi:hypothetical protein